MKFKAFVYDTTTGEPMILEVRNINVQAKTVVGHNGMRYQHFKLFHVIDEDNEELIAQVGECDSTKHGRKL